MIKRKLNQLNHDKSKMRKAILNLIASHWLKISLLLLSISILSLTPFDKAPIVVNSDKTAYFLPYGILAISLCLVKPKFWQAILFVFFLCSGLIELIQPFVNRLGEWLVLLANRLGLVLGAITATEIKYF